MKKSRAIAAGNALEKSDDIAFSEELREIASEHPQSKERHQKRSVVKTVTINLLITFVACIFSLLLVELGFRLLPLSKAKVSSWSDRPQQYYIHADSDSFQDYPIQPTKPVDGFRVAVVGDSFTFAPYMQFDDSFPKKLERMLRLSGDAGLAEVINLGVPGYSASHEVDEVKRAIELNSDLILLQITLNDPQRKPYTPTGLTRQNEFGTYQPSGFVGSLTQYWRSLGFVLNRLHNSKTHTRYREYYFNLFDDRRSWRSFTDAVARMKKLSEAADIPFVAVVFPLFGIALDDGYPFHPLHQRVHSVLSQNDIKFLDLFDSYRGIPLERIQVIPHVDFHPNEIGHRIAGEEIYRWLVQEELIPAELQIKRSFSARTDIRLKEGGQLPH